ncbi:MAG TPA: tetratricopeptide repeat protein [Blastocatellia bacterium]|nr:tetratricopeptide repeat protein [Blastocatellia bacterium]
MIELNLTKPGARVLVGLLTLAACALLALLIVSRFVIGTLADRRLQVTRAMLKIPVEYLPGSARLNARLAAAEFSEGDRDLASAKLYAERAVNLSPFDHRIWLTLASIEEATGDRRAAESALRAASLRAPNYWSVHYRLGNLLVREGKVTESLEEFRKAIAANDTLTLGALDLVWQASRENVDAVRSVCENNPKAKLALAQFFLVKSKPVEAAEVFMSIDRGLRLSTATDSSNFLNGLIAAGKLETARDLWGDLVGVDRGALIWNGGFESDIQRSFSQFDWSFNRSEYAVLSIDPASPHSGSHSLKVEFAGRDTTRLDNEIRQLVAVTPGARYVLECYFKTEDFEAPEGPRIVVTDDANWIAASEPVPAGSSDWRRLSLEFVAPQTGKGAVVISIKRKPRFSYDEPTRGTVWFDDFSMKQV